MRDRIGAAPSHAEAVPRPDPEARLSELARSRGALRWVLARLACALVDRSPQSPESRKGWDPLGYVRADDYARERLGLSGRSLQDLARVGRALPGLPRLEAALASGALPWSKVRLLARFAEPGDEAHWIALARRLTVRQLERRVRAVDRGALGGDVRAASEPACDEDGYGTEPLETVRLRVGFRPCFKWQRTRKWAAREAGRRISPGAALEMITAEAISALPRGAAAEPAAPSPDPVFRLPRSEDDPAAANVCAPHGAAAEPADDGPAHPGAEPPSLLELPAFLRPLVVGLDEADPFELDARLRRAVRLEQRLDAELAPLLRLVSSSDYEWRARPPTLASLARDRLGMSPRKARALIRLERLGDRCPELRSAWRDGSISWVQAQILSPLLVVAGDEAPEPAWRAAWLTFAQHVTVRRLEDAVDRALTLHEADLQEWLRCREHPERIDVPGAREASAPFERAERQTCARTGDGIGAVPLRIHAPRDVARLFRAVLCSLRRMVEAETGRLPPEGDVFEAIMDHALSTWRVDDPRLRRRGPLAILDRDGWRCAVPGCTSRRNLHVHHIRFRSAGGSEESTNLTTLCAAHHLRGVHAGHVRVSGSAPDGLWFELGVRPGNAPLVRYRSGDRVA